MKRFVNPKLSSSGEAALAHYRQALLEYEDLTDASRRNYLSDPLYLTRFCGRLELQETQIRSVLMDMNDHYTPTPLFPVDTVGESGPTSVQIFEKEQVIHLGTSSLRKCLLWTIQHSVEEPLVTNQLATRENSPRFLSYEREQVYSSIALRL